ncbi:hypothetical protein [Microbacterium sp. NPDC096154]|uniref:hypothetical protein n=1 Tax=Microbacterium sp. NPDC096154 TaxID=3155549 RepID=UPI003317AEFB
MSNSLTTARHDDRRAVSHDEAQAHQTQTHAARLSHPPGPPQQAAEALQQRAARTALPDRVAMWIGLRLLLWGTRPERAIDASDPTISRRDARALRLERALDEQRAAQDRLLAQTGLIGFPGIR